MTSYLLYGIAVLGLVVFLVSLVAVFGKEMRAAGLIGMITGLALTTSMFLLPSLG